MHQERRAEFEEFTGYTHEELREMKKKNETKEEKSRSVEHCTATYLQKEFASIDAAQKKKGIEGAVVQPVGADATKAIMGNGRMMKMHGTCWTAVEREEMVKATEHPWEYLEGAEYKGAEVEDDIPF